MTPRFARLFRLIFIVVCGFLFGSELRSFADDAKAASSGRLPKASAKPRAAAPLETTKPLSPEAARAAFRTPADLDVDLVLAEPIIKQPLFLDWDERGRLWVVEYCQYPYPAGLKMVSHDEFWRAVYDKVPEPPPHHVRGLDRISIHEDTDGDGRYDKHSTFVDGLSIATSFALGGGGVWVLNPPYLLFYPDRNADGVPDGDPEVHLKGFGIEDTHSAANSLCWGPDGWLYAAQGSTVSGHVARPGFEMQAVHSMGQLIWRYHPKLRKYEIFAEGGGNAFGIEIDSDGRVFSGHNGGDTRGFYYVQGGYSQKGFEKHGPLSNPFAFGFFPPLKHHSAPRFTHKFLIYDDDALPAPYRGKFFGVEPLQGTLVYGSIDRDGSTFKTADLGRPVSTSDPWFRPVFLTSGPDGAIYFCDFYEPKIAHREHFAGDIDKSTGRIYRLRARGAKPKPPIDLQRATSAQLVDRQRDPNQLLRRTALRLLRDRGDASVTPLLLKHLTEPDGPAAREALWALNGLQALTDDVVISALAHSQAAVRTWAVRLSADDGEVSPAIASRFVGMVSTEKDADVSSQLASSARRLPANQALPILAGIARQDAVVNDPHIPLLVWWGIEAHAERDRAAVLALFDDATFWKQPLVRKHLLNRTIRRYAAAGGRENLITCAQLFRKAPDSEAAKILAAGFEEASRGKTLTGLPAELAQALTEAGAISIPLGVRLGRGDAIQKALTIAANQAASLEERLPLVSIWGEVKEGRSVPILLDIFQSKASDDLKAAALAALSSYDDPRVGPAVVAQYRSLSDDLRTAADSLLASRKNWTAELLQAVDEGHVDGKLVALETVRKMTVHRDPPANALIAKHFPSVQGATSAQMKTKIGAIAKLLNTSESGDPYHGKRLFEKSCAKCHILFGEGGRIGPDLTTFKRNDWLNILINVVNPSAEIREGFEQVMVVTNDGRAISGFRFDQDNKLLIIRGADGQNISIERSTIEELLPQSKSLMPEGLLDGMQPAEVRDLFAYLCSSQPITVKP